MTLNIVADENIPQLHHYFDKFGSLTTYPGRQLNREQLRAADVLLVRSVTQVNQQLLQGTSIRFVGTCTIGTDHLDKSYLAQAGVTYASAPGCNANSVVEYVLAALAKVRPDWLNCNVGVIGCGNVGGHLLRTLTGLDVRCVGYDPLLPEGHGLNLASLEEALQSDIVCLHTPHTVDGPFPSFHLLNRDNLPRLKNGAVLLNAGRGGAIDNSALHELLLQRQDLNVVLDVWEREPDFDTELLEYVVLATPHIAGYSIDGKVAGTAMIARALGHFVGELADDTGELEIALPLGITSPVSLQSLTIGLSPDMSWQQRLNRILSVAYCIGRDDRALRDAVQTSTEVGSEFDRLRKTYPPRLEFNHYSLTLEDVCAGLAKADAASLGAALGTLGFTLSDKSRSTGGEGGFDQTVSIGP